jgi:hypothetical protein
MANRIASGIDLHPMNLVSLPRVPAGTVTSNPIALAAHVLLFNEDVDIADPVTVEIAVPIEVPGSFEAPGGVICDRAPVDKKVGESRRGEQGEDVYKKRGEEPHRE